MIMYPQAGIEVVQISLASSLDPQLHIQLGQALYALRKRNILIIASGFSYHNMKGFQNPCYLVQSNLQPASHPYTHSSTNRQAAKNQSLSRLEVYSPSHSVSSERATSYPSLPQSRLTSIQPSQLNIHSYTLLNHLHQLYILITIYYFIYILSQSHYYINSYIAFFIYSFANFYIKIITKKLITEN